MIFEDTFGLIIDEKIQLDILIFVYFESRQEIVLLDIGGQWHIRVSMSIDIHYLVDHLHHNIGSFVDD